MLATIPSLRYQCVEPPFTRYLARSKMTDTDPVSLNRYQGDTDSGRVRYRVTASLRSAIGSLPGFGTLSPGNRCMVIRTLVHAPTSSGST